MPLLLAAAYFAAILLDTKSKLKVMAGVDFVYYAMV
jgi:hypothetical protein